jgi:hypothetical protein
VRSIAAVGFVAWASEGSGFGVEHAANVVSITKAAPAAHLESSLIA